MVNPASSISQQFYQVLTEDLPTAWNDDDYSLLELHYKTTKRLDPAFQFPQFEDLIKMRKNEAKKYTADFDALKLNTQTIAALALKKVAPMAAKSHRKHLR